MTPVRKSGPNLALRLVIIGFLLGAVGFTWNRLEHRKKELAAARESLDQETGDASHRETTPFDKPGSSVSLVEDPAPEAAPEEHDETTPVAENVDDTPAPADPSAEPPFPAGVWRNPNDKANLLVFQTDHTCRSMRGNTGTWSWTPSAEGGTWVVNWASGYADTFHLDGTETDVAGSNNEGSDIRFEQLPFSPDIPVERVLGRWIPTGEPSIEYQVERDGLGTAVTYTDGTRTIESKRTRCTWRRGPNGNQIAFFWDGNEQWFNVITFGSSPGIAERINQRNEQSVMTRTGESGSWDPTDLTTAFPNASAWEGTWSLNDNKRMVVSGVVTRSDPTEVHLTLRSDEGEWTCIVRNNASGHPEITDVRVGDTSRYSKTMIPGRFDSGAGLVRFRGSGFRKAGSLDAVERLVCDLKRQPGADAAAGQTIGNAGQPDPGTEEFWKTRATEDFPALADPDSALSRGVKSLVRYKDKSFKTNPDWPYRVARESALSLLPHEAKRSVPEDAMVFRGAFFTVVEDSVGWEAAFRKCKRMGGRLASVPDQETNQMIHRMIGTRECWIGATDEQKEGAWIWSNESVMKFRNFDEGQPDNNRNREHFLSMLPNGRWNDVPPNRRQITAYICEWPAAR